MKTLVLISFAASSLIFAMPLASAAGTQGAKSYAAGDPVVDWSGFYAGLNLGYGLAGNTQFVDTDPGSAPFAGLTPNGGFVGAQVGYNIQMNSSLVAGLEADFQGANISATGNSAFYDYKSDVDAFGTVRGRLGYEMGPTLLYVTGGLAYGDIEKITNTYGSFFADAKLNSWAAGYVVGAGVEYKVSQNLSLKAEYQYMNFGKNDVCASPAFQCFGLSNPIKDDDYHLIRIGVNYHF